MIGTYQLKVNNRNTRTSCQLETYLTPCSSASIINFVHLIIGWVEVPRPNNIISVK